MTTAPLDPFFRVVSLVEHNGSPSSFSRYAFFLPFCLLSSPNYDFLLITKWTRSLWFLGTKIVTFSTMKIFNHCTVFENHPKCRTWNCQFWHYSPFFGLLKIDISGNTVWPQALGFLKLAKIDNFGIFNELLSTQNVNVARFARNVECDFFCDFQPLCSKKM